jgi:hypothetical protein
MLRTRLFTPFVLPFSNLCLLAACSATTAPSGRVGPGAGAAASTLRTRVVVPPVRAAREEGFGTSRASLSGQNAAAGLEELAYAIRSIAICKDLTPQGSGFTNPQDCLSVYDAPPVPELAYDPSADLLPLAAAARATDAPFVDLLTAAGRARLATTRTLTTADVREYQYGYVTWYPPIKIRASVAITGGPTLRTVDGPTSVVVMPDGFRQYVTTGATPFASAASAARAVVLLPNGGNWFKFQRPLVVRHEDVGRDTDAGAGDAGAGADVGGYDLDLVFDPEGMVAAFTERAAETNASLVDATGAGFRVPMVDLAPVVRTAGKVTVREDWVADLGGGLGYRLSLYGLEPDPNRTVYGVLSRMVMTGSAVTPSQWMDAPKIAGVSVAADGAYSFADGSGTAIVRGLRRSSAADAGATASAELRCTGHDERPMPHGFFVPGCATGTWRSVTFTAR